MNRTSKTIIRVRLEIIHNDSLQVGQRDQHVHVTSQAALHQALDTAAVAIEMSNRRGMIQFLMLSVQGLIALFRRLQDSN